MRRPVIDRDAAAFDRRYDVVVVGAGITGVQIAREFATRGRSVLVVDKDDLGAGTSSATTKYIHGGIRYLEQYDVAVVRESLRERRILALAAPHLVRQTPFVLPVWAWSKPGRTLLSAGAAAYHALAFDRNRGAPDALRIERPAWFDRAGTMAAVPWLDPTELRGAVVVTDTLNIHPERLLLALALDAVHAGATVRTHCRVTGIDLHHLSAAEGSSEPGTAVRGVEVVDEIASVRHHVRADTIVNAGGPWMAEILATTGRRVGPTVKPSKGVHLLTRPMDAGITSAVMARARDGRHVVVSPWQGRSFIGPTDTPVGSRPDDVAPGPDDVDALLRIVNSCRAPDRALTTDDVDDVTVGIRPLVATDDGDGSASGDEDSYRSSRRHHVHDHRDDGISGLWSVSGGKWTTGRAVADDVVGQVIGRGGSRTQRRPVHGAAGWAADPNEVFATALQGYPQLAVTSETREHLGRLYGTRCVDVFDLVADDPELGADISSRPGCRDIGAQVIIAVRDEGAVTLSDIVDRRLVLGTLGPVPADELRRIAALAAPLLGWPDDGRAEAAAESRRRSLRRSRWQRRQ